MAHSCFRGAQCKHPKYGERRQPLLRCIGSAVCELARLEREYTHGLPASDPPAHRKQQPRSRRLSELVEDALSKATCLSGEDQQRCCFHVSCEDERRDPGKCKDQGGLIKVIPCREPQEYSVRDPELGEERLVPSHESQVYHRAYIRRGVDHLLCSRCWDAYARSTGHTLVAYPPGTW